ncbi:hypothetical protein KCH_76880 [Kitasatospora cheerisanensis KCTC 2395]|uniref:Uncharacterized protein n=1 Tax=Kitasatospora cheerisanensis KCTC 2395 TaxID=1348663 RepID=A0A066YR29_9ACTN|nr:hypothetical protein KCH_76880 [Kitasatospora cheerisanensis KCTC 2395]
MQPGPHHHRPARLGLVGPQLLGKASPRAAAENLVPQRARDRCGVQQVADQRIRPVETVLFPPQHSVDAAERAGPRSVAHADGLSEATDNL